MTQSSSSVYRHAVHTVGCVEHRFRQCRMRVDRPHQILYRGFEFHGGHCFRDQFGGLRADDVYPKDLSVVRVRNNLDEAFVLADDAGARVRGEREFANFDVVSGFSSLCFRQTHAADLRMAIGGARDTLPVNGLRRLACDLGNRHQSFHGSDVGQLWRAEHDVADRVDSGFGSLLPRIHLNEFAFRLDLRALQPDVQSARLASDGDQNFFGIDLLLLAIDAYGHSDP